jgi:hypothetical protein
MYVLVVKFFFREKVDLDMDYRAILTNFVSKTSCSKDVSRMCLVRPASGTNI